MDIFIPFRNAFDRAFQFENGELVTNTEQLHATHTLMFKYGFLIQLVFGVDETATQCHFDYNNPISDQIEMTRLYTLCSALRQKFERLRQPYITNS